MLADSWAEKSETSQEVMLIGFSQRDHLEQYLQALDR